MQIETTQNALLSVTQADTPSSSENPNRTNSNPPESSPATPEDTTRVSDTGRTLALAASGSLVRQRSTSVVIETREGDRITLNIQATQRIEAVAGAATDGEDTVAGAAMLRNSSLSLSFRVDGSLNRRELKSLARVLHHVEKAAKEFYEGETEDALKKLGKMKIDPKTLASVSVDFRRSLAVRYAEIQRMGNTSQNASEDTVASTSAPSTGTPVSPPTLPEATRTPASSSPQPKSEDKRPATASPAPSTTKSSAAPKPVAASRDDTVSSSPEPNERTGTVVLPEVPARIDLPETASPVARFAVNVRRSLEVASVGGLFRSPETGIKALFHSVLELVAELRDGKEKAQDASLPELLDSLLEALLQPEGTEADSETTLNENEDAASIVDSVASIAENMASVTETDHALEGHASEESETNVSGNEPDTGTEPELQSSAT